MNPSEDKNYNTSGASTHGSGSITPDAGPDIGRAEYSSTQVPEDNESQLDEDVNEANPQTYEEEKEDNVGQNQIGIVGRTTG
ncbi:hypothetical protein [Plectonema radiosum]|uniref:Uncharacterized protein n=1 Tax=Plectonema cf. radiosum LEGE 06105 TaxID=945769 RepID=A0A8J7EXN0_9CYAN|nr:hypothetical protein [Plectonema radiosum]MBE9211693.1 hypothetical protein [Plectonema cf. radiosum LEGE 06105]